MPKSIRYFKIIPILLIIAIILFIITDQFKSQPSQLIQSAIPKAIKDDHTHTRHDEDKGSLGVKAQKRMGIYHYNEGNKFLKQNHWEEAVKNYRMALHHNKNFNDVYINLSTAYLIGKQFKESLKTLNTLKKINPNHPLLHYNFACYYSLTGSITLGLESLKKSISNGFKDFQLLKTDPDLRNLRSDSRFKEIVIS